MTLHAPPPPRQVYCLPDSYEVLDRSLDDIRYVLNPLFTRQEVAAVDQVGPGECLTCRVCCCSGRRLHIMAPAPSWEQLPQVLTLNAALLTATLLPAWLPVQSVTWSRSLDGTEYMPGLVGLNNMKNNDYANVVIQVLARIGLIRWAAQRTGARSCKSVVPTASAYCRHTRSEQERRL